MAEILLEFGADPNQTCKGISPLHASSVNGVLQICRLLVSYGADVNIFSQHFGTPIHAAVQLNHKFISNFLIVAGCDLGSVNAHGETPLHIGCMKNYLDITTNIMEYIDVILKIQSNYLVSFM